MKFSYDESYLPLKRNLTGTLGAQGSAEKSGAEQPRMHKGDIRRTEPLRR